MVRLPSGSASLAIVTAFWHWMSSAERMGCVIVRPARGVLLDVREGSAFIVMTGGSNNPSQCNV